MPKTDYQSWTKEDLVSEIERLKKRKKYGLVWEEKTEDVIEQCKKELPVLKEVTSKEIITDQSKPINLLIEGDNYHALSVLNYTHAKKVDVIYIDPPYNRGGDFKYNDNYIEQEDPYRHSKWLSFMEKRLKLANNLLSDDGIALISIDNHEMANLKLLCDEIFRGRKAIGPLVWQKASGGGNAKNVVVGHEYVLCYANNDPTLTRKNLKHFGKNFDKSKKYIERDGKIYFINDDIVRKVFGKYPSGVERRCEYEDLLKYKDLEFKNEVDKKIKSGEYILTRNPKDPKKHFICALEDVGSLRMVFYSIILGVFNAEGKEDFINLGFSENDFEYPKPVRLIKLLVDSIFNKNALVLDFFAGTGTTAQAVLELNKEDGGNRQFILCTNNENNICTDVCYPRVKKVIEGYTALKGRKVEGLGGNLKYFKTDFVDAEPTDQNKKKLTEQAIELLCIKEGTFEKVLDQKDFKIFKNSDHYTGIIFDQLAIPKFKKRIKNIDADFSVYVFSLGDDTFAEEFSGVKQKVKLSPIPEAIFRIYRRIFR